MNRAEEMRELLARWERSGQSLLAFGKAEGISYTTLQYWRRKFRDSPGATEATSESPGWAEVRVVPDAVSAEIPTGYEVWLPNGISLEVRIGFDAVELRRLVEVLTAC